MAELTILDSALEGAIWHTVRAVNEMSENVPRPNDGFAGLTGISGEVELHLRGLQVGRAALADAALTAGRGLHGLMHESDALDARLAGSLNSGFSVQGAER
ncbi:hypothetical protein [Leucobacter tenebrionis]|uniref:hypothetical protein n=1 Tax=Leucobacter tenebrionis TaxID=2873270 RepID=UPI001CA7255D|nr:hypothetical protein [Leucobacter tenebrionis]QZY52994.1 hypothetical protein KVY00_06055 [Leucobacter tenebrionis]